MSLLFRAVYYTSNGELEVMYFGPYATNEDDGAYIEQRVKWIRDYLRRAHNAKTIESITHKATKA